MRSSKRLRRPRRRARRGAFRSSPSPPARPPPWSRRRATSATFSPPIRRRSCPTSRTSPGLSRWGGRLSSTGGCWCAKECPTRPDAPGDPEAGHGQLHREQSRLRETRLQQLGSRLVAAFRRREEEHAQVAAEEREQALGAGVHRGTEVRLLLVELPAHAGVLRPL